MRKDRNQLPLLPAQSPPALDWLNGYLKRFKNHEPLRVPHGITI